jgi:hypothetical protein
MTRLKMISLGFAAAVGFMGLTLAIPQAAAGPNASWCVNEAINAAGPNRCTSNNDCDGARTCSPAGFCQGTSRATPIACTPRMFYRQADKPEVYFQFSTEGHCHVQNEWQMAAYGGFDQVKVVPRVAMNGRFLGACGWPNGFYRRESKPEVYRLTGETLPGIGQDICHVINETQMAAFGGFAQVKVVPDTSDIGRGRKAVRPCANP